MRQAVPHWRSMFRRFELIALLRIAPGSGPRGMLRASLRSLRDRRPRFPAVRHWVVVSKGNWRERPWRRMCKEFFERFSRALVRATGSQTRFKAYAGARTAAGA